MDMPELQHKKLRLTTTDPMSVQTATRGHWVASATRPDKATSWRKWERPGLPKQRFKEWFKTLMISYALTRLRCFGRQADLASRRSHAGALLYQLRRAASRAGAGPLPCLKTSPPTEAGITWVPK